MDKRKRRGKGKLVSFVLYDPKRERNVTVRLAPGEKRYRESFSRHEEGHSGRAETIEYDAEENIIRLTVDSSGRDCDGPHSHHAELVCPISKLATDFNQYSGRVLPDWKEVKAWQRDIYAERMGY